MALIKPFPDAPWFSIDEDQYLMYLLKGYEIKYKYGWITFTLNDKLHREDGPAVIWKGIGEKQFYLHGWQYSMVDYYALTTASIKWKVFKFICDFFK